MLRRLVLAAGLLAGGVAHADDPKIATYAIVVGSNAGGPGQVDLKYAEDDARRVATVLTELGGYRADQVDIVVHPTPDQLRDRLTKLGDRVAADTAAGRQARIFFYYSGHARSQAIDLGAEELPLPELRERLFKVPATLTVVVLDACQSGAFSRIKGAQPAADFSYSSRQHLDATGVAVLASSSGSELSQESLELHSSYFTHHLLVGLRGAGDANNDGEVSIDEAYRYAYHQTLLATAETAVGGQHVTFEADLKGHGEVALSFPRAATAQIVLPRAIEGKTLVEDKRAHVVVAETYKAHGAPVRIAVAPGEYEVLVRHGTTMSRCQITAPGEIDLDRCKTEAIVTSPTKGLSDPYSDQRVVVGVLAGNEHADAYTESLGNFGYTEDLFSADTGLSGSYLRRLSSRMWVGANLAYVAMPRWTHDIVGSDLHQSLDWNITTITAIAHAEQPFATAGRFYAALYGQLGAGLGIGRTHLAAADSMVYTDSYYGPAFSIAAGIHLNFPGGFGLDNGYEYDAASAIKDLIGNTHISGGHRVTFALTYGF